MRKYIITLYLLIFSYLLYGWNSLHYHTHKAITDDAIKSLISSSYSSEYPDICVNYKDIIIDGSGSEGEDGHPDPKLNGGKVEAIWKGFSFENNPIPDKCKDGVLVNFTNGLISQAYQNIGRICHLTNDQAVPAHAANIFHAVISLEPVMHILSQDLFERWTDDNYITGLIANVGTIEDEDYPYKFYQDLQNDTRGKIENNTMYSKYWRLASESYKTDATDYEAQKPDYPNCWGTYTDEKYRKGIPFFYHTDDPAIVYYQLKDAVDNTARALATASIKLPSYIKPLNISNDIDPKLGTELRFKVYENRKNEITYSVFIDNTANYVVDVNGKLLKDVTDELTKGTILPWEKEFSFIWNGKYLSGTTEKFPTFGKHKLIYKVVDKDKNETFEEYEIDYVPKVFVLINGRRLDAECNNGVYSYEDFNISLNKEQILGIECYHGDQKLDKTRFLLNYEKTDIAQSVKIPLEGLQYRDETPDGVVRNKSTYNYTWNTKTFKDKGGKIRISVKAPYTTTDQKSELFVEDSTQVDTYRPITLSSSVMVFKKPDAGTKTVVGHIAALQEKDTLKVTVPLSVEPDKWNGVEVLLDGELSPNIAVPALPEPTYREYGDSIRVYKFVWDYSEQPEGFVTMRARYKDDPLSFDQKKIKVGYSTVWEDFENGMENWQTLTQYAYPLNAVELHYWRTGYKEDIKSTELCTSSASFTAQRFEILSPVIKIPPLSEDVETFLYFDYARELSYLAFGGGRSLMVMQVCDESGNPLPNQLYGSLYQGVDNDPITGYPLNLSHYFSPNIIGFDLYPDGVWNRFVFWLNWKFNDYSGQNIRIKFIQFYTTNYAEIIDNNTGFVYNPPTYTDLTFHRFDNFQVCTYYQINLPPTIDKVADQEVKQHCGWQKINLTGITNGENAILGDDTDLEEDQGSKSSLLSKISRIKDVEQREDGSLKITAFVQEDSTYKEVTLPSGSRKGSKFLPQQVVELTLYSDNRVVIPADSLKLEMEYAAGDTSAVLMYRPEDIESGSSNITVTVRDDGGILKGGKDLTEMKFKVTVKPFNPPKYDPPITKLESITEDFEEFTIDLGSHFRDPDGDKIYYKYSADSSLVKIERTGDALTVKSVPDAWGTGSLTIVADDSTGTIPTMVSVPINIANDFDDFEFIEYEIDEEDDIATMFLPTNFEAQSINMDEKIICELTGTKTYTVTLSNTETLNAGTSGSSLNLTPKTDVKGSVDATLGVSVNGRTITDKLRIIVGNLPPVIKAEIADIETDANFKTLYINLKDHYTDPNKDWLGYSVRTTQNKIDTYISFYDDQLIIESKANESGVDSLYISIYDGEFTVRDSLKITIGTPATQVPYLTAPIPDQRVKEDFGRQEIDLNNHFADPDNVGIAYVVDFDSTKVKCTIDDGHILVITSVKNFHGYAPISVGIADGKKELRPSKFDGCDPKNVVRIREKIKKKENLAKGKKQKKK